MSVHKGTPRSRMPHWPGGNRRGYRFGSELLAWMAPAAGGTVGTVPSVLSRAPRVG